MVEDESAEAEVLWVQTNAAAEKEHMGPELLRVQAEREARKEWKHLLKQAKAELQDARKDADREKQERLRETERANVLEREVQDLKQETATLTANLASATTLAENEKQERMRVLERALELKQEIETLRKELQLRKASSNILESVTHDGYWVGNDWVDSNQLADGYRECEKTLRRLLESNSPHIKERAVKLFDMPCPRGLKALRDRVWEKLSAALGEQYVLLSSRVITNNVKSGEQVLHRDVDLCESPPVLIVFMLPMVEVTKERGPTEVLTPNGAVLMTSKLGAIYGFDAYLEHRSTANGSCTSRPALVLDCCLRTHRATLKKDALYN
jgi:hypothetical protein